MDDRQVRREYESIKRFVTAAVARGKTDREEVYRRYEAGEDYLSTDGQLPFHEGQAAGFLRCAEMILAYIEEGEKIAEEKPESVTVTILD